VILWRHSQRRGTTSVSGVSYCPGQAGFSIGFSSSALRSQWVADPAGGKPSFVGGKLLKVSYISEADIAEIDLAIDDALQVGAQLYGQMGFFGPISGQQAFSAWFSVIAPSYKSSAFFAEREWRMVLSKPHKPMPGQRFRPGKSTVIRYIEVELNRDLDFKLSDQYMIRKVFVGANTKSRPLLGSPSKFILVCRISRRSR
jgi:hypothetical protein